MLDSGACAAPARGLERAAAAPQLAGSGSAPARDAATEPFRAAQRSFRRSLAWLLCALELPDPHEKLH